MTNVQPNISFQKKAIAEWFDGFIGNMKADKLMMEENFVTENTKVFYDTLILGSEASGYMVGRTMSSMYFIRNLVQEYLNELNNSSNKPKKLALDLNDSKVLVWAEIIDDDDEAENKLIIAEAKINAKYNEYGFNVQSTIVEQSDLLPIPPHYQTIIDA